MIFCIYKVNLNILLQDVKQQYYKHFVQLKLYDSSKFTCVHTHYTDY